MLSAFLGATALAALLALLLSGPPEAVQLTYRASPGTVTFSAPNGPKQYVSTTATQRTVHLPPGAVAHLLVRSNGRPTAGCTIIQSGVIVSESHVTAAGAAQCRWLVSPYRGETQQ